VIRSFYSSLVCVAGLLFYSACTLNDHYATMPVHFTKVDSAETFSIAARPISTLQIRVSPLKNVYLVGSAWLRAYSNGPFDFALFRQEGKSLSCGLGLHTASHFRRVQLALEGGLATGTFDKTIEMGSYYSEWRNFHSYYKESPYLKAAFFFDVSKKLNVGLGLLYQQMNLSVSSPESHKIIDPDDGTYYTIIDKRYLEFHQQILTSVQLKWTLSKLFYLESSFCFSPYLSFIPQVTGVDYSSFKLGFGFNLLRRPVYPPFKKSRFQ
jgi:hypothetical protein